MNCVTRIGLSVLWIVCLAGGVYWLHEPQNEFHNCILVPRFVPGQGHVIELVRSGGISCEFSMSTISTASGVVTRGDSRIARHWKQVMLDENVGELQFSSNSRTYAYILHDPLTYDKRMRIVDAETGQVLGEVISSSATFSGDGEFVLVEDGLACKRTNQLQAVFQLRPFQYLSSLSPIEYSGLANVSYHGRWLYSWNVFADTRSGKWYQLGDSVSAIPLIARSEQHAIFTDRQGRTHWFDLATGHDAVISTKFDTWITQLPTPSESETLFIAARTRIVPSGLKRLLGPSSWLVNTYEQDLVDIVNPATGDRPRWLACRGKFVAVSRDGAQLVTRDSQHRHLVWQLNQ